jgi:hypothetical protein
MEHKDLTIDLLLDEDETDTVVHAKLQLRGDEFESVGKAHRRSSDRPIPVIGEELAVARALGDLTNQVTAAAQSKIETFLQAG